MDKKKKEGAERKDIEKGSALTESKQSEWCWLISWQSYVTCLHTELEYPPYTNPTKGGLYGGKGIEE